MKRNSTNKFKEKINEIEYSPTQADWKSFSSALDKTIPFDSGMVSGAKAASGGTVGTATASSWASIFSKIFLSLAIGVGIYGGVSFTSDSSSKADNKINSENKQILETVNNAQIEGLNKKVTEVNETKKVIEGEKSLNKISVTKSNIEQPNEQLEATINENKANKITSKKHTNAKQNLFTNKSEIISEADDKVSQFERTYNSKLEESITKNDKNDIEPIVLDQSTKDQKNSILRKEESETPIIAEVGLNYLPSRSILLADEGIENLLNEYSSSLLLSEEANIDLVFNFENVRLQAMSIGSTDYVGLGVTVMEPIKGNEFIDFFVVGLGVTFLDYQSSFPWLRRGVYGEFKEDLEDPKIFTETETSISLIAEAKKYLWRDRLSAYVNIKPELIVARTGSWLQNDVPNATTYYTALESSDGGLTKELMFSAGLGIDFRFSKRLEVRFGYEQGFVKTIDASLTHNNKSQIRGHFNIGLNYSFKQKIK